MDENLECAGPLVDHLHRFCDNCRRGDPDGAAAGMLDFVRASWPDISETRLPPVEDDAALGEGETFDADEVALAIIRDVGEIADFLVEGGKPGGRLAWSRANLIVDLELYARAGPESDRGALP